MMILSPLTATPLVVVHRETIAPEEIPVMYKREGLIK